ncbi:MAG: CARDB domain-containing protein [Candidatus Poseidoniaceae archaeon]|tara:strand:- start:394 stop:3168 length:2775 start_codon:yes stop_codon:yes gene_type:complete
MAGKWQVIVGVMILSIAILPANIAAYNSGGIEASEAQVALSPSTGLTQGDSVTIYLTLSNTLQSDAFDVEYAFYMNDYTSSQQLLKSVVDIYAQETETVSVTWDSLQETDSRVWVVFEYGGNEQSFFIDFDVAGLPNLRIMQSEISPSSGINSGDTVQLSTLVKNTGSEPAVASTLQIDLPSTLVDEEIATSALSPSQEEWINTTFTAPSSGTYSIYVTPDYHDEVIEASENNKVKTVSLIVEPRMDVYHLENITITSTEGSLEGPWTIAGKLARTGGSGTTTVPMWIEVATDTGGIVTAQPFDVILQGTGYAEQSWSTILTSNTVTSLPPGGYLLTAQIDPFDDPNFLQESKTNDRSSALLTLLEVPDVFVDSIARPSSPEVNSGERVTWEVTVQNTGGVDVSGKLEYEFEGVTDLSILISLEPGESYTWVSTPLQTGSGAHQAPFKATWIASQGSSDSNPDNNIAINDITVKADLRLEWAPSSLQLLDSNGNEATYPLDEGDNYTISINLTTQELGEISFDCLDGKNEEISTTEVNVSTIGQTVSLECEFTATAPLSSIQLRPSDPTKVTTTYTRQFSTAFSSTDDSSEQSKSGTMTLIGFGVVILIVILGLAVWFTRESEEEVERDIFEYCPACDGELEGDESRCPHCSFNLDKARKQFHQCHECGESVPDLMDNCPYCGAHQDVSSFFERREKRERRAPKVEVALPEVDEDEIVSGTENFDETVKEFGYDEDQLEEEWDEKFAKAEAEIAELEQSYEELGSIDGLTPEEIEELESQVTTKLRSMKQLGEQSNDIDEMLAGKGDLISHKDDGSELSASDAEIRGRLYEITGEEGIMPGDKVHVGMNLSDGALAGNEIEETSSDFTFEDDQPIAKLDDKEDLTPKRQQPKRREKKKTAECGACGAQIPIMAKGCPVCGAEFE